MVQPTGMTPCTPAGRCQRYLAGHMLHFIHARLVGQSPWGWRQGVVRSMGHDNVAAIDYVEEDGAARVWFHLDLTVLSGVGDAVRVHERFHVLETGGMVANVALLDRVGAVPDPSADERRQYRAQPVVAEVATGLGHGLTREGTV